MSLSKSKLFVNIVRYKFLVVFCIFCRFLIDFQEVYTQPHCTVWDVLFSYIPKKMLHWCCIYLSVRELQAVLQHLTEGSIFSRVAWAKTVFILVCFCLAQSFPGESRSICIFGACRGCSCCFCSCWGSQRGEERGRRGRRKWWWHGIRTVWLTSYMKTISD